MTDTVCYTLTGMMNISHVTCPLCGASTDHAYELFDLPPADQAATHLGLTCTGPAPHLITVQPTAEVEQPA